MTSSDKKSNFPPALVSNLQEVLASKRGGSGSGSGDADEPSAPSPSSDSFVPSKPILLLTNSDGIESLGLNSLVEALLHDARYNVHVCAPDSDKSVSGHSVTPYETILVCSADIKGTMVFQVSGTPADCVSLALSGALFPWSKPTLVISGINKGSSCGYHTFYSGAAAGAREALISGVPSLSISLNWKKDESHQSYFKDAVDVCLPLIHAAIRDIDKGHFPKGCSLNLEVPTCPSTNKGFKITRRSLWRSNPSWQAVSANRIPSAAHFMAKQQNLGMQLAQLGRDASAAGAARRMQSQMKMVEIESVAEAKKVDSSSVKKFFRLEFVEKEHEETDEDLDFRALENGFVAVTPLWLPWIVESEVQASASDWLATALATDEQ